MSKNEIGNNVYSIIPSSYPDVGVIFSIIKKTIIKETPKKFKIEIKKYNNLLRMRKSEKLYKKEDVNTNKVYTIDDMFDKLEKTLKAILDSDDNSKNTKIKAQESYDELMLEKDDIIEYFDK